MLVDQVKTIVTQVLSVSSRYSVRSSLLKVCIRVSPESGLTNPSLVRAVQILTRCQSVEIVVSSNIPADYTVYHLDNQTDVGLFLKGMIDVNVETDKINQKLGKLEKKFAQLIKTSEKASKMTSEKHQKLQNEISDTEEMIKRLKDSIKELEAMRDGM